MYLFLLISHLNSYKIIFSHDCLDPFSVRSLALASSRSMSHAYIQVFLFGWPTVISISKNSWNVRARAYYVWPIEVFMVCLLFRSFHYISFLFVAVFFSLFSFIAFLWFYDASIGLFPFKFSILYAEAEGKNLLNCCVWLHGTVVFALLRVVVWPFHPFNFYCFVAVLVFHFTFYACFAIKLHACFIDKKKRHKKNLL